jgi:hypothetical protein
MQSRLRRLDAGRRQLGPDEHDLAGRQWTAAEPFAQRSPSTNTVTRYSMSPDEPTSKTVKMLG